MAAAPQRRARWRSSILHSLSSLSHLWIHATLLLGLVVFLFPFLWMVLTSLRTDEELIEPTFLPRIPTFTERSPYVRRAPALAKPIDVPAEAWDEALPRLRDITSAAIRQSLAGFAGDVNQADLADAVIPALINQLAPKIRSETWSQPLEALEAEFDALLTGETIRAAADDRLARLELRGVQVRTIDGHVFQLAGPAEMASQWKVTAGNASIDAHASGAWLRYAFENPSAVPVVLEYDFELPTEPQNFHKLLVNLKLDDSWHRVDATLDIAGEAGGHWVSQRTTYIAQHRPGSIIFQPPSFDDETFRNKIWVPLRKENAERGMMNDESKTAGAASSSSVDSAFSRSAKLRLIISPSSTPRAIYGKVLRNYERAFYQVPFLLYIVNSVIIVTLTTLGALFSSTFVAYAFARLNWPGRSVALVLLLSTMMLPAQVTMIPQFVVWRQLGWYNTLNPLWVPAWFGSGFFIFLMIQHMKTIPRELEEAARIDGLNALQTWWYIIVPLVRPAAAAIAILTVMASWNEFMKPLIYLRDQAKFPLSLGLFGLRVDVANDWTLLMAGNVMMTLPVLLMFFLFQRYFIQGMTMSGMKG